MVSAAVVLSVLRWFFFSLFCLLATPRAAVVAAAPTPSVCANSGVPVVLAEPLRFCGNTGISCCDAVDDNALREELDALRISDATCAAIVKSFLCTKCIPSLSFVFTSAAPTKLSVPLLCGSAQAHSGDAAGSGSSTATTTTRPAQEQQDTNSMCLERISATSFDAMTAHPDGSDRVFLTRDGKLWLATMPRRADGAGADLQTNDDGSARPFLDLTDHDGVLRVVGVAFHPKFAINGRFFVSYISDSRSISPTACGGAGSGRSRPCRYLVVAEFSAHGGAGADFSQATRADSFEVRRIFTVGLPQPQFQMYSYQRHGGQILFRPSIDDDDSDGYLYLITGYGYSSSNKLQNRNSSTSFLGKILRFNVGNGPAGGSEWPDTDRHPKPEMFVAGLNNPSTCSFDSVRPFHLLCADVNEQRFERVYLITEKQLDGTSRSSSSSVANVSVVVDHGRPADGRMPSIVGGLVYRGSAEPSLKGRYLYVYASGVWSSGWSGRYASTQFTNVRCSWSSPVPCGIGIGNGIIGGRVLSMAEDNRKDAFFLTTAGVFRIVPSGACGGRPQPPPQTQWPDGTGWVLSVGVTAVAFSLYVCWTILGCGEKFRISGGCCSARNFCSGNSFSCCSPSYSHES